MAALDHYGRALSAFDRIHEEDNAAALHSLVSESLEYLGRNRESWRHRYMALRARSRLRDPRRLLLIYQVIADSMLRQGEPAIALSFQREAVRNAERTKNVALLADALFWQGLMRDRAGDRKGAMEDLKKASAVKARSSDRVVQRRIEAGIALAEGEIQASLDPRSAIARLTSALRLYERTGHHFYALSAHRARAMAYRRIGDTRSAEADLLAALQAYKQQGEGLVKEELRLAFLEQTWNLFDEMIAFQVEERHAPERAFAYADRALTQVLPRLTSGMQLRKEERESLLAEEPESVTLREVQRRLPLRTVLVQYSVLNDRLLIWLIRSRQSAFFERPVTAEDLLKRVNLTRSVDSPGWPAARRICLTC